jgi:hypothetical protein
MIEKLEYNAADRVAVEFDVEKASGFLLNASGGGYRWRRGRLGNIQFGHFLLQCER